MRLGIVVLGLSALCTALASPAFAGFEEICLKDGRTGMADVLETSKDSLTVEFVKEGAKIKLSVPAARLDPHCFYDIRRRNMEETAENHILLAVFAAKNGMFKRASFQVDVAVALDPEYVEKLKETPGVREGFAKSILASGEKFLEKGDLETAEEIAVGVCTRFHDLPIAIEAQALSARILAKRQANEKAAAGAARAAMDEAARKEAERIEKALAPVTSARKSADKIYAQAGRSENPSNAKKGYNAAAAKYVEALRRCEKLKAEHDHADVGRLEEALRGDAVRAYLSAGTIALNRGSYKDAKEHADRALKVDPESSRAQAFSKRVETAIMMNDTFDARYRRGGRPGGGGRR